ncbi:MAG: hypothetical protein J2P49_02290 [Methylocapsa sp.]|nr:hypothetical protein [Methylocapsa sp.]
MMPKQRYVLPAKRGPSLACLGVAKANHSRARLRKAGVILCGVWLLARAAAYADPALGPFAELSGSWSGGGTITMADGSTERLRCRAANAVHGDGTAMQQDLRCASASYRLDIRSNVVVAQGGSISGNWAESSRGVSGQIAGHATASAIAANVQGAGFAARIDVHTRGDRQSVTISPQAGTDVARVSVALHK